MTVQIGCKRHGVVTTAGCRYCELFATDSKYRVKWGGEPLTEPSKAPTRVSARQVPLQCVYRGFEPIGREMPDCGSCRIYGCAIHGSCVLAGSKKGNRECLSCDDRRISTSTTKHLLYHVYPIRGNGIWQLNLDRLRLRLPMFTGKKCIAIAVDNRCDDPGLVRAYLGDQPGIEWIEVGNEPSLREMKTWGPLWERVDGHEGQVFYGHAKGTTRPCNPGTTIHAWTDLLYRLNLDHMPLIEDLLTKHPVAGAFRKAGAGFRGSSSSWHFSGSFYWLNLASVGDRWRRGDRHQWYGVESWPGIHWSVEQAGCHFGAGRVNSLNLYRMSVLRHYQREYEAWKSSHLPSPSATG